MHKSDNTLVCHFYYNGTHCRFQYGLFYFKPQPVVQLRSVATCARHSRAREEEPEQLPEGQFYVEKLLSRRRKVTPCILGLLAGPYRAWDA